MMEAVIDSVDLAEAPRRLAMQLVSTPHRLASNCLKLKHSYPASPRRLQLTLLSAAPKAVVCFSRERGTRDRSWSSTPA
jgi:hypothetical protein